MQSGNEDFCKLLGPISLLIQVIMGSIAVGVLLIKRHYEHPKRTWIVWSYDLGKQVLGSLGVHFFNVMISVTKAGGLLAVKTVDGMKDDDQCDWFFLNLLTDTTIGIPILWFWLRIIHFLLVYFHVSNIESGNYYPDLLKDSDPIMFHHIPKKRPLFSAFLKQLLAFISGLLLMKACILLLLNYFEGTAVFFANLVLGWADPWPNFQVFLVMFVAPVALNCFQYLCIDNIIKLSTDSITEQNVDNFDQESIIQENGVYVTNYTNNHKLTYGTL